MSLSTYLGLNYLSLLTGSEPLELSGRSEGLTRAEQTGKDLALV